MYNIKYESDELKIKFIDSSQNEFKEKRFWELLK